MLYGLPGTLIVALTVLGCPIGGDCEKVKKEFEHLKDRANLEKIDTKKLVPPEERMKEVQKKFESLKEVKPDKNYLKELANLNTSSGSLERVMELFREYQINLDLKKLLKVKREGKRKVIFYLFSRSVPASTVESVFRSSRKLEGYDFYGVLRGIDKKTIKYLVGIKSRSGVRIKINPIIFEKVGANVVPAFVYAECPAGEFRSRLCEYKYVLYGDTSLEYALEKFMEKEGK